MLGTYKFVGDSSAMVSYQCWKSLGPIILFLINNYVMPCAVDYDENGKVLVGELFLNAVKPENTVYGRKKNFKKSIRFFKTLNE